MARSWNRRQAIPRQHDNLFGRAKGAAPAAKLAVDNAPADTRSCGECLMERVEVVHLDERGVCPKCGTNYGPVSP